MLAERVATVERHRARVAARLPADPAELRAATDASDAVILHLWQAVQIVIDLGLSASACSSISARRRATVMRSGAWPMPEWWNPGWRNG